MFDFKKCHPIELDDLVRVGHESDGGYVLPKRCIEKTDILLSFGISDDWSFEDYFTRKKKVRVFSYDYSIKDSPWVNNRLYMTPFLAFIFDTFTLNWRGIKRQLWRITSSFQKFFDENAGRHYIPKFIGPADDEKTVCFNTVFEKLALGGGGDLSVFLKMDIEGGEYQCLRQIKPYTDKINGMAVEFHDLGVNITKFKELLDLLKQDFHIAHIHNCNFAGLIPGTNIPLILEMTFINKNLVPGDVKLSKAEYPLKGIDFPDYWRKKDDYKPVFEDYTPGIGV